MKATVRNIQTALNSHGYQIPIDGAWGRLTLNAVKQFQRKNGLEVDGIVGPLTSAKLFAVGVKTVDYGYAPWMERVNQVMGLHERRDNTLLRRILGRSGKVLGDPAQTPWCGWLVNSAIAEFVPEEALPSNPFAARNWANFGVEVRPSLYSIGVFWRQHPNSWKGHVGFIIGHTKDCFIVRGGNQRNMVCDVPIKMDRLITARFPSNANQKPRPLPLMNKSGLILSTNEA